MKRLFISVLLALFGASSVFGQASYLKAVENLAALKKTSITDVHIGAIILGTTTRGDGGEAIYYFDPASAATPDDAGVVLSDRSATGRWIRLEGIGGGGGSANPNAVTAATAASISNLLWASGGANRTAIPTGIGVTGPSLEIFGAGAASFYHGYIDLYEQASVTNPDAGTFRIWQSDDGTLYLRDSSGNDTSLNGGGSPSPWTSNIDGGGYGLTNVSIILNNTVYHHVTGSETNIAIDVSYGEHVLFADTSYRFYFTNTFSGTNLTGSVWMLTTNSTETAIYATNVIDVYEWVGQGGVLYEGNNEITATKKNGFYRLSQDTSLIPQSQVDGLEADLAGKLDTDGTITVSQVLNLQEILDAKQEALVAGDNITIDENNVITASGSGIDFSVTATTPSDTLTPVWTNSLATNKTLFVSGFVAAAGPTNSAGYNLNATFRRGSGSASVVGTNNLSIMETDAAMASYFALDGNDVKLYVKGPPSETNNWAAKGLYHLVENGDATAASGTVYLVKENFEASGADGYDLTGLWTESGVGTIDENYATDPSEGSQSLRIVGAANTPNTYTTFANTGTVDAYFMLKVAAYPATTTTIMGLRSSTTADATLFVTSTGTLFIRAGGGGGGATTDSLTAGVWYHVRVHYEKHDGSVSRANVEFSTDGTFAGSGSKFQSTTSGTVLTDANRIYLGHNGSISIEVLFDKVRVNPSIGNNPD